MSTKEVVMTEEWNESDDFKRVGTEGLSGEDIGEKSLTYWADVWRRFRENKLAIFGLILLGLIVVLLFIGPMVTGQDYQLIDASIKNQGPSSAHWFGTDDMGRDLFTRVCVGGRISIYIGLCCTLVMFVIGALLGALAGLKGGLVDDIIMRICEFIPAISDHCSNFIHGTWKKYVLPCFCNEPYRVGRNRAYGKRTDPSDQGTGLCAGSNSTWCINRTYYCQTSSSEYTWNYYG